MIEARNLTERYGGKTAVDDLSFTVARGKITGFLGPVAIRPVQGTCCSRQLARRGTCNGVRHAPEPKEAGGTLPSAELLNWH